MYGLVKIALDAELEKSLDFAFRPQGEYKEVQVNDKPATASLFGTMGGMIGSGIGATAGGIKPALAGGAIGGLTGAALGYGLGRKTSYRAPDWKEEQQVEQDRLWREHPEEALKYITSM